MNPLKWLKDKLAPQAEHVTEEEAVEIGYTPNRGDRRHWANASKLRGPGYTRAFRKGRTQRVRTLSDDHTNHAAEAAEGRSQ